MRFYFYYEPSSMFFDMGNGIGNDRMTRDVLEQVAVYCYMTTHDWWSVGFHRVEHAKTCIGHSHKCCTLFVEYLKTKILLGSFSLSKFVLGNS